MDGIISKERVKEFGEVFTPDSIVTDMIKLVNREIGDAKVEEYVSKIFLEPACGDGQFLVRILSGKMEKIKSIMNITEVEKELLLIKALCSTYGVDIQRDNVTNARDRMYKVATGEPVSSFDIIGANEIKVDLGIKYSDRLKKLITWILEKNIICGDTLDCNYPVMLTDYKFNGDKVSLVECPLNDLKIEINKQAEVYYLDLPVESVNTDDEAEYDF